MKEVKQPPAEAPKDREPNVTPKTVTRMPDKMIRDGGRGGGYVREGYVQK